MISSLPAESVVAVVVTNTKTGKSASAVDAARVYFHPFSGQEIDYLIEKGDLYNSAGSFTVEGPVWKEHVKKIDGAIDSVIGLHKELTKSLIDQVL